MSGTRTYTNADLERPAGPGVYTNADLNRVHGEEPSRGTFSQSALEDVAYMPESVYEDMDKRARYEAQREVMLGTKASTKYPGLTKRQEQALVFEDIKNEAQFAAMDRMIDQFVEDQIAEISTSPGSPQEKASGIAAAKAVGRDQKIRNRQIGVLGWPRTAWGQPGGIDPFTGEPVEDYQSQAPPPTSTR